MAKFPPTGIMNGGASNYFPVQIVKVNEFEKDTASQNPTVWADYLVVWDPSAAVIDLDGAQQMPHGVIFIF